MIILDNKDLHTYISWEIITDDDIQVYFTASIQNITNWPTPKSNMAQSLWNNFCIYENQTGYDIISYIQLLW